MHTIDKTTLFSHITEQHVDDVAFLWLLRSRAVTHPQHTHITLKKREHHINAHLKGLAAAPEVAWALSQQAAEFQQGGEAFTLAMLAFDSADTNKITAALDLGMENPATFEGLLSALGWLPADKIHPWLKPWMAHQNPAYRHLSIATCSIRRINPHHHLTALFADQSSREHLPLYCRMLRLVGELKRQDLAPVLVQAQNHDDPAVVFQASRSAVLLGNHQALQTLAPYLLQTGPLQAAAIEVVFRHPDNTHAAEWLNTLADTPGHIRPAIKALAALGDPHGMEWLLAQMEIPEYAKIAGEAYSTLTGVSLEQAQLINTQARTLDSIEMEKEDDETIDEQAFDEDLNLPLPQVEKVRQHWQQQRSQFTIGQRYFLGRPVAPSLLKHTFLYGQSRHRLAAALALALQTPEHIYPNAKATFYQQGAT